jgi:hypothetical protein
MVDRSAPERPRAPLPPWAELLTRSLDDAIRIPGTRVGIGLDGLVGLFLPGLGDSLTGLGSLALFWVAFKRGVPAIVVGRMVVNVAVDALVGLLPFAGDLFDFAWRANRKNLELIDRYSSDPTARPGPVDYVLVGLGFTISVVLLLMPLILLLLYAGALTAILHTWGG